MKKKWLVLVLSVLSVLAAMIALAACGGKGYSGPDNIAYDGQYITWDKAQVAVIGTSADYYNVSINGGEKQRSNSTTYAYASSETFEVTVAAVFDGKEKASASVTFKPLPAIEEVFIADDGSLSWNAVVGANAYSLTINGQAATTTDTHYELPAGNSRVKVKPIVSGDSTFYSSWSKEVSASIYNTPTNIKYDGATLSWTGNASEYLVTVNGVPMSETARGNSCQLNSENKDFTVEVKALGNHTSTYDSKAASEEFHYLDPVTDLVVEDGILKWTAIAGAEGYKVKIGGVEQKETVTQAEYDKIPAGASKDVSVMPVNNSGNYFSSWSVVKRVYILETPVLQWNNDLELDGEANNNVTWNAVNAAGGYTVRLMKDGVVQKTEGISVAQLYFAEAYHDVGVYTVEVKANAESGEANYYDSKYSAPITVERLAAPRAAAQNFIHSDPDNLAAGFTVNFIGVNGASGYQLYKDGAPLNGKYTANSSALTDNNVTIPSNMAEQNFTYMVRSMGGHKTVSGKDYITLPCLTESALSFNIIVQATPQNPIMDGYDLTWDATAGTNGYTVSYSGTNVTASAERLSLKTLNAGTCSVTVCARGNGSNVLASNVSTPVTIERLQAPTNIRITPEKEGTLEWDEVSNATGYQVFLDLSERALDENAYDEMYQFIKTNGTTLSMVAVANKYNENQTLYYMSSENSPTQQFIRLEAPTFPEGAVANSIELLWNAPANINTAEYTPTYQLYSAIDTQIGGGDVNGTRYNIEHLEGGKSHNFYVKAVGNETKYLDSELSVVKTVYKLQTPSFKIQDDKYVWDNVTNASSYVMMIDGVKVSDEFHISGSSYSYVPRFTSAGEHIVTLQAIGDGRNNLNSKEYRFTQKTQVLQSPVISYKYSAETFVKGGTIDVTIKTSSPNAKNYQYEIAGESITSSQLTYSKVIKSVGKYSIRVKALGGVFDAGGIYYIDSAYAGGTAADVIVLLGAPSSSSFSLNTDGVFRWGAISGAFGYDYQISYDDADYGAESHTAYNALDPIKDYTSHRTIKIRVRARGGNNGKTVTSEWIEFTWTNPKL